MNEAQIYSKEYNMYSLKRDTINSNKRNTRDYNTKCKYRENALENTSQIL